MQTSEISPKLDTKNQGQVFTPGWMVNLMLDHCKYWGTGILRRHVIDNSCGDGAFLIPIVHRYIQAALQSGLSHKAIRRHLTTYIHGIEKDPQVHARCLSNLERVAAAYGFRDIPWDIRLADALTLTAFDGQMHYVIGNPPYVRIHHLTHTDSTLRSYTFSDRYNTDLYITFYDLGIRMLSDQGKLCYITPCSWLYSSSGKRMRDYLVAQCLLTDMVSMGHTQVFPGITTYTVITGLTKGQRSETFRYYVFDEGTQTFLFQDELPLSEAYIDGRFYLGDQKSLATVRSVKHQQIPAHVRVKNGLATLADKVFINSLVPDSPYTIQAYKASTGQWSRCFYPYDRQAKPLSEGQVFASHSLADYLISNKQALQDRDIRHDAWWQYGRTQALNDTYKSKLAVNMLLRDEHDIKYAFVAPGQVVYSGYYVTTDSPEVLDRLPALLTSPAFASYVMALGKYKSGGYYTFNALDLEQYLNFQIQQTVKP